MKKYLITTILFGTTLLSNAQTDTDKKGSFLINWVKGHKGNILKQNEYHYQGQ